MRVLLICAVILTKAVSAGGQELLKQNEKHFKNVKQLTFGGDNAEAYFSGDGAGLIFQATVEPFDCDQIFTMNFDGSGRQLVSSGLGRTTCAFLNPRGTNIIYSSTFAADSSCPSRPSMAEGYVWPIYPGYEIYSATPDGSNLRLLASSPGYDAEAVYSPDGSMIAFTSTRDGDLEIYVMNNDGHDIRRVTYNPGYDGGAFFSPDGLRLVFRAQVFEDEKELQDYRNLLSKNLVRPFRMEIFTIKIDGSERTQITNFKAASFAPYYHPSGKKIIFSSDLDYPREHNFELYLIDTDGANLERVTFSDEFDGFPMFSYDGSKIVFASNRNNARPRETNIFIANWVE